MRGFKHWDVVCSSYGILTLGNIQNLTGQEVKQPDPKVRSDLEQGAGPDVFHRFSPIQIVVFLEGQNVERGYTHIHSHRHV